MEPGGPELKKLTPAERVQCSKEGQSHCCQQKRLQCCQVPKSPRKLSESGIDSFPINKETSKPFEALELLESLEPLEPLEEHGLHEIRGGKPAKQVAFEAMEFERAPPEAKNKEGMGQCAFHQPECTKPDFPSGSWDQPATRALNLATNRKRRNFRLSPF